ncbi:MAG: PstA family ABC transporter permease, partial [Nitrospiria bacterium]
MIERKLRYRIYENLFAVIGFLVTLLGIAVLLTLIIDIFSDGFSRLNWQFLTSYPSRRPGRAGILSAWVGTVWIMVLTGMMTFPIGVAAATYLEEYAKKNWLTDLIEINIANLAGVPSIIYGLLGLVIFVRWMDLERSVLAGAMTLAILVLPIVILSSREALRTIPLSVREASYA